MGNLILLICIIYIIMVPKPNNKERRKDIAVTSHLRNHYMILEVSK